MTIQVIKVWSQWRRGDTCVALGQQTVPGEGETSLAPTPMRPVQDNRAGTTVVGGVGGP